MARVALVRCNSYKREEVEKAVALGIKLIGGLEQFFYENEKVLLKPNMLAADHAEKGSTTNPAVFYSVAKALQQFGVKLTYGDSPAIHKPLSAAKKCGIKDMADELNIPLADFENGEDVFVESASLNKKFNIAKGVMEADSIVSLPKLKAHGFARMTGSVKNQFGCIPGKLKGEMHVKLPDGKNFSRMLVDLNNYVKPKLYVMDGIIAMEGNGPRSGDLKKMNVLLFSDDPIALDATVCRMMDLKPEYVETINIGYETGMGTYLEDEIEILGDTIETFKQNDFKVTRRPMEKADASGLRSVVNQLFVSKPYIVPDLCVKCGLCVNMCPVEGKAVDFKDNDRSKVPEYDYSKCIRCYCCQEMCPESAIKIKTPAFRKVLDKII